MDTSRKVDQMRQNTAACVGGKIPIEPSEKKLLVPSKTKVLIYADSDNEKWTTLYDRVFCRMEYKPEIVIFDGFSSTEGNKRRFSQADELEEHIRNLTDCGNLITVCLVNTTYTFNPIKFKTNWGAVKPIDLMQQISDRFVDSVKIMILDNYYKYNMERGLEVLQTSETELNTYPAIIPLIKEKPINCTNLISRSLASEYQETQCSLFTISFLAHSLRMMSMSAEFSFSGLVDKLMYENPINPVSGVMYQSTLTHISPVLNQPLGILRMTKSLLYKVALSFVLIIN